MQNATPMGPPSISDHKSRIRMANYGNVHVHELCDNDLEFVCPIQNAASTSAPTDPPPGPTLVNVLAFSRPFCSSMTEEEPVQNSLTFEESDKPFRRFPQHLIEIMRRDEQARGNFRYRNPAPLCGIFAVEETSIAWVAIRELNETTLFLFSANPERGEETLPVAHVEQEEIVAVCVVPPLSLVGDNHRIAIGTVCGVRLYQLVSCADTFEIDTSTGIFFSIPDIAVTCIVASDTGRLFAGCSDGFVHELQYKDNVARKNAPSVDGHPFALALSHLPVPLFLRDRIKQCQEWLSSKIGVLKSETELWNRVPVVDMCVHSSCRTSKFPHWRKPSKIFLWALKTKERQPRQSMAAPDMHFESALQLYEVHSTGLRLLYSLNEQHIINGQVKEEETWISKIFPVEPWQEEQVEKSWELDVARICAVFANGRRRFYKYSFGKKEPFSLYAEHSPPFDTSSPLRNHDHPCCFHNGRFVRVNRDNGSVISSHRSSFENARTDQYSKGVIPAFSQTLRCSQPAGRKMKLCVVAPVPPPPEIGRLIALGHCSGKEMNTVHDAFWQVHSEQQDYLVMYSYGSDHCGVTLVTEYSLRGRIRHAFRRQQADCHRNAVEDAFKRRISKMPEAPYNEMTAILQVSLVKATQLQLYIDCRLSQDTSDMALQNSMHHEVFNKATQQHDDFNSIIMFNAWRFCVYNELFYLYNAPLFSHISSHSSEMRKATPELVLSDDRGRWKRLRDFFEELLRASGDHPYFFRPRYANDFFHFLNRRAIQNVINIASVLCLLSSLLQRWLPNNHSFQRNHHSKFNSVREFLFTMDVDFQLLGEKHFAFNGVREFMFTMDAPFQLLRDIFDISYFGHLIKDQEVDTYLKQYFPDFYREKQFLSVLESLTVSQAPMHSSFCNLKLKMSPPDHVSLEACILYQSRIHQHMLDNQFCFTQGWCSILQIEADMKLCALMLGYTDLECKGKVPQFWKDIKYSEHLIHSNLSSLTRADTVLVLWQSCRLQPPNAADKHHVDFPFLFQAPVEFVCRRILFIRAASFKLGDLVSWFEGFTVLQIYERSLKKLLLMAYCQKMTLLENRDLAAVGTQLFQDAIDAALSLELNYCSEMVCNWLEFKPDPISFGGFFPFYGRRTFQDASEAALRLNRKKSPTEMEITEFEFNLMFDSRVCDWPELKPDVDPFGGISPLHGLHNVPDTHPFFTVMASKQHHPFVEEWISGRISMATPPYNAAPAHVCSFYCCLLLEYLSYHNRVSDFCKKTLEMVDTRAYGIEQNHRIAWLKRALDSANSQSTIELPQKLATVEQIRRRLHVLSQETQRDSNQSTPRARARSPTLPIAHSDGESS